jgi:hypothetical protein
MGRQTHRNACLSVLNTHIPVLNPVFFSVLSVPSVLNAVTNIHRGDAENAEGKTGIHREDAKIAKRKAGVVMGRRTHHNACLSVLNTCIPVLNPVFISALSASPR